MYAEYVCTIYIYTLILDLQHSVYVYSTCLVAPATAHSECLCKWYITTYCDIYIIYIYIYIATFICPQAPTAHHIYPLLYSTPLYSIHSGVSSRVEWSIYIYTSARRGTAPPQSARTRSLTPLPTSIHLLGWGNSRLYIYTRRQHRRADFAAARTEYINSIE